MRSILKVKVKSLFWVHVQAQSSALQTFDKYLPWSLGLSSPSRYPSQLPWEYTDAQTQLDATAYKSALAGTYFAPRSRVAMKREVTCSGRGTGRELNPGLDLDPDPETCILPLDQLAAILQSYCMFSLHSIYFSYPVFNRPRSERHLSYY